MHEYLSTLWMICWFYLLVLAFGLMPMACIYPGHDESKGCIFCIITGIAACLFVGLYNP